LRAFWAFHGHFQQLQDDRLVFAQHFAGGDAEQQCVTDLTCCAGDGNADGLFAHGGKLQKVEMRKRCSPTTTPMSSGLSGNRTHASPLESAKTCANSL
jgi:hypothetical protein